MKLRSRPFRPSHIMFIREFVGTIDDAGSRICSWHSGPAKNPQGAKPERRPDVWFPTPGCPNKRNRLAETVAFVVDRPGALVGTRPVVRAGAVPGWSAYRMHRTWQEAFRPWPKLPSWRSRSGWT